MREIPGNERCQHSPPGNFELWEQHGTEHLDSKSEMQWQPGASNHLKTYTVQGGKVH